MTWSTKYKKSIDCNNPKGFSQKAHCQARKLRQMGKKTESKPVMDEDAPVNNAGGGQVAGIGVGPQGEPGIQKKRKVASFISFITRKGKK